MTGRPIDGSDAMSIVGAVEHGDHRGRTLGFPTANIRMGLDLAHIDDGVYAAIVRVGDRPIVSAVSVGRRPTFYAEGERLCEAHLVDFEGDLYGQVIQVELRRFLRGQYRFDGIDELVDQLRADVDDARRAIDLDAADAMSSDHGARVGCSSPHR